MSRTSNRQWVWAILAGFACIAAVALACPSSWSSTKDAAVAPDAGHGLSSAQAATAGATPSDDVAARVVRGTGIARFDTFPADDAPQGAADDLAARRAELGADGMRPEAMITEAAGSRYAALDVQSPAAAPQAATKR
jgi:hypothetical protein